MRFSVVFKLRKSIKFNILNVTQQIKLKHTNSKCKICLFERKIKKVQGRGKGVKTYIEEMRKDNDHSKKKISRTMILLPIPSLGKLFQLQREVLKANVGDADFDLLAPSHGYQLQLLEKFVFLLFVCEGEDEALLVLQQEKMVMKLFVKASKGLFGNLGKIRKKKKEKDKWESK